VCSDLLKDCSSQIETFNCWICQSELSNEALLLEHYENHMNSPKEGEQSEKEEQN